MNGLICRLVFILCMYEAGEVILRTHQAIQSLGFGLKRHFARFVRLDQLSGTPYVIDVSGQLLRPNEVARHEKSPVACNIGKRVDLQMFDRRIDGECNFHLVVKMTRDVNVTQGTVKEVAFKIVHRFITVQQNATARTDDAPTKVEDTNLRGMDKEIDRIRGPDSILPSKAQRIHTKQFPILALRQHFAELSNGDRVDLLI